MNFSSMEYFVVLSQERNFTRAAERLHITQQSLSSHIAGLEKELGCKLVIRHIPLEITYAGQMLLKYAEDFRNLHSDMEREFCDISQNQKGVLRIGSSTTRGKTILPDTICQFSEEYPNIMIEWIEGPNDALHQELIKGTVDVAIADFPQSLPGIKIDEYYSEETVLIVSRELLKKVCGKDYDRAVSSFEADDFSLLKDCPFVLGGMKDLDGRIGMSVLKNAGISNPHIKFSSHNLEMLLNLCRRGVGACFCPKNIAESILNEKERKGLLQFHLGEAAEYPIRFGYKERSYQWSVIEKFMECAIGNI
ncbi:MAG: LysR family transcriptional regulator [Firmicutes bacterium]|nr:LysR family transcriptional regulator [Bacillota bacterium]